MQPTVPQGTSCPPCNKNCNEGRACPARAQQTDHAADQRWMRLIAWLLVSWFALLTYAALALFPPPAHGQTVGLHIATAHFGGDGLQPHTPGLYARADSGPFEGLTLGGYRNSYGLQSRYLAYTLQTASRVFALTVGAVTGYPARPVLPMLVPSARVPLGDTGAALRLAFIPKPPRVGTAAGLHVAIERGF